MNLYAIPLLISAFILFSFALFIILKGEKIEGEFIFKEGEKLLKHDIKVVEVI